MYIPSSDIRIYPTSKRDARIDYTANINTESNVALKRVTVTDYSDQVCFGFDIEVVSSASTSAVVNISAGRCVISGYIIDIDALENITVTGLSTSTIIGSNNLVLALSVTDNSETVTSIPNHISDSVELYASELAGSDSGSVYTGLDLSIRAFIPVNGAIVLGQFKYDQASSSWIFNKNLVAESKFNASDQYLNIKTTNTNGLTPAEVPGSYTYKPGIFASFVESDFCLNDSLPSALDDSTELILVYDNYQLNIDLSVLNDPDFTLKKNYLLDPANIKAIIIPGYVKHVNNIFGNCINLKSLVFPSSTITVTGNTLNLPERLSYIVTGGLNRSNLGTINCYCPDPPILAEYDTANGFAGSSITRIMIPYFVDRSIWQAADGWSKYSNKIFNSQNVIT